MGTCMIPGNQLASWGHVWCEPMTVATDGLLLLLCGGLALRHAGPARGFFGLMAVAFGLGGVRHLVTADWPHWVSPLSMGGNTAGSLALTALVFAMTRQQTARGWRWGWPC